jgi:hypothetical protein
MGGIVGDLNDRPTGGGWNMAIILASSACPSSAISYKT